MTVNYHNICWTFTSMYENQNRLGEMGPIGFEGYSNTDYIEAYLNLNYQITFWYVQIFNLN